MAWLSPSSCHSHVAGQIRQSLRYDGGDLKGWQRRLRRKLRHLLGAMPKERVPLNVRSLWRRRHALGVIEKIVFASEPHADVPAYVCLPSNVTPPFTFVVCLQGHQTGMHESIAVSREDEGQQISVEGDRDFALGCMARGVAALCIEQRGFGLRREQAQQIRSSHPCVDGLARASLLGRTLAGERIYDVDRAIDYLASRDDADMRRIGLMGLSGGGMITITAMGLLPRVRFAMPVGHFCTYRDGLMAIHHCPCCYVPGLFRYAEMADVAGLFAPRPIVIVSGRKDKSKPIRGVQRAFRHLRAIYEAAGAGERCHLVIGDGGHRFYAEMAWPVMLAEIERLGETPKTGRRDRAQRGGSGDQSL